MDRHIDARTLSENLVDILEQARRGTRFVVSTDDGPAVEIKGMETKAADAGPVATAGWPDSVWAGIEARDLPPLSMEEIDEEIAAYRREKRDAGTAAG